MITDSIRKSCFFRRGQLFFLSRRSVCDNLVSPPEPSKILWKSGDWTSCFGLCWRNYIYVLQLKLLDWSIWLLQLKGKGKKRREGWGMAGRGWEREGRSKGRRKEGKEKQQKLIIGSSVLLNTSQCIESLSAGRVIVWIEMCIDHRRINTKQSFLGLSQASRTFFSQVLEINK